MLSFALSPARRQSADKGEIMTLHAANDPVSTADRDGHMGLPG